MFMPGDAIKNSNLREIAGVRIFRLLPRGIKCLSLKDSKNPDTRKVPIFSGFYAIRNIFALFAS